jgi:hypothetical protein
MLECGIMVTMQHKAATDSQFSRTAGDFLSARRSGTTLRWKLQGIKTGRYYANRFTLSIGFFGLLIRGQLLNKIAKLSRAVIAR